MHYDLASQQDVLLRHSSLLQLSYLLVVLGAMLASVVAIPLECQKHLYFTYVSGMQHSWLVQ